MDGLIANSVLVFLPVVTGAAACVLCFNAVLWIIQLFRVVTNPEERR